MIDKKTEAGIKAVKSFIEFWTKFHHIYNDTISKGIISKEDEEKFLETKDVIKAKYGDLTGIMEFKYMPHGRLTDPVSEVLNVETIRFISEENQKRLNNDWKDSYIFLNNIQERLKEKRRRMEDLNPVGVFLKKIFNGGAA
ncbi:MAG: hypothetical protein V1927_04000 [Candidatus Omnitrophota bacterium]